MRRGVGASPRLGTRPGLQVVEPGGPRVLHLVLSGSVQEVPGGVHFGGGRTTSRQGHAEINSVKEEDRTHSAAICPAM